MRGNDRQQATIWSTVQPEERVPADHPLRPIRQMANQALKELSSCFDKLYAQRGRPSIAPEKLLRALLLQAFYSIRSERQLMEQLDYNILFRWFVGLSIDDPVWDATVFSKNRERLLEGEVARAFLGEVVRQAQAHGLISQEHFSVDGTLLKAWASHKSFQKQTPAAEAPGPTASAEKSDDDSDDPGNPTVDFRGEKRTNATHQSKTDPEARLYRKGKGQPALLCYLGHLLMENRHGLAVDAQVTLATGTAEREAALEMVEQLESQRPITLGADKAFDTRDFVDALRALGAIPHVAQNAYLRRKSNLDKRTTRHAGYAISQRKRKLIEEIFGWLKTIALLAQVKYRGCPRVRWWFIFAVAAYDLVRMRNLIPQGAAA